MPQLHTKNGASPQDLLAFFSWAEIFIGAKLSHNGLEGSRGYYHHMRSTIACNIGMCDGQRDIVLEVADEASCQRARKCFPKLFYKPKKAAA